MIARENRRGSGAGSKGVLRQDPARVPCPKCGAAAGARCAKANMKSYYHFHLERLRAAASTIRSD